MNAALPKATSLHLMKRLIKTYLKPYAGSLAAAMVFMAVSAAMTAALAHLMQPILDDVLNAGRQEMIIPIGSAVFAVFFIRGISTYTHVIMMNKTGQSIVADIQKDLFSHFMTLDLAFFHANPSGQLLSRVISDVNIVRTAITDSLTGAGKNFLTLVFLIAVMFSKDWKLTLAAFAIAPFASGFVAYIGRRLRQISGNIQHEMANLSDRLSQIFQGIRQVQAYGMEDRETHRAARAIDKVRDLNIKSVRVSNMSTPVNEILIGLVASGIIIYGGYQVTAAEMTTGQLAAFLAAFTMAYEPMKKLARLNNTIQTGMGGAERIFSMLDLQKTIRDKKNARALGEGIPEILFENVVFSYEDSEIKALNQISFRAAPGQVTALVGPSGGGKSTVINLIPRFYDVQDGRILIDGQDIRDLLLSSLRSHIGLVSQDITIFDDTIAANIAYGRTDASDEEIRQAARQAAADDFICEFPDGYETQAGEDGVKLSGGQRQRIAIARALLRDAPILLLDEATSSLDAESEQAVQEALKELEKGRTTLVIAHRLSTVKSADQIIVLDQGRVVETGTHDSLMEKGGLYAKMYETGFRD